MNSVVEGVGGLDDCLIKVRVGGQELKPTVEDFHIRMSEIVLPTGVRCFRNLDVSCFTKGMSAGVCATDFDIEDIAAIATTDDNRLTTQDA